jgi:hypothetical protein
MLEIILVFMCARSIGKIVADKGRTRIGYQLMLIGLWIGGEIAGLVLGFALQGGMGGDAGFPCMAYIFGLVGAAAGAGIAFAIAHGVSPLPSDDDFYRRDPYGRDPYGRDPYDRDPRGYDDRRPARGDEQGISPPRDYDQDYRPPRADDRVQE